MVNTPLRPRSSSLRLRFISVVNLFILSLSWRVGFKMEEVYSTLLKCMLNLVQFWMNDLFFGTTTKSNKYLKFMGMSPESR